jgi:hypothetical protein
MCMYNAFNWLLKVTREKHMALSIVSEPTFCMKKHPCFLYTNKSFIESMRQSQDVGVNKHKVIGLTWVEE